MQTLDQEKITRLYSVFPDVRLPPSVLPYAILMKPLKLFMLTCMKLGDPAKFTPMLTVKTAFELFLTSYLDEDFRLFDVLAENQKIRMIQKRRPLEYMERRNQGAYRTINLPFVTFTTLISSLLKSKDFVEAMKASMKRDFAEAKITAADYALFGEFLPKLIRLAGRGERHLVVFNLGILPVSKPLPDNFLKALDPAGYLESPETVRAKYARFKPVDEFNLCLERSELEKINDVYTKMAHSSEIRAKKHIRQFNGRKSDLVVDRVLRLKDPHFLDEKALHNAREAIGIGGVIKSTDLEASHGVDTKES